MIVIFDLDGTLFQTADCDINAINLLFDELNLIRINEQVAKRGKPFINVEKMLAQLKSNGHSLYICSNSSIEYIRLVLNTNGITDYFDNIISAKDFKSKSDAVKHIIKNNSFAVIVGDTSSDIEVAVKSDIPSISVRYGYGKREDLLKATYIADSVTDIVSLVTLCDLFYKITNKIFCKPVKVIGINGVDTSGKTTFTEYYSRFLKSIRINNIVLHIDDFHNPSAIRLQGENEIDTYYNNAFNYNQLIDEVLQPLKMNNYIEKDVMCLDLDTDKYEKLIHYALDRQSILLIEGVLLFRQPLIDYFDGKIFLNIDFDEVINRAVERDVPKYGVEFLQKYIDKYIPIQKRYLEECKPAQIADVVVNNQNYKHPRL